MRTLKIDLTYNPQPKQKLFHTNSAKYRLFLGAWRSGKCLYLKQKVRLANGESKEAENIQIGDIVLGYNRENGESFPCKVISTEKTIKQVEKYILSDGTEIVCSPDHRFPCSWQGYNKEMEIGKIARKTKERGIDKGHFYLLGARKVNFAENEATFKIPPYILGLLLGDGGMTQNFVSFSTKDVELLRELEVLDLEIKKRSSFYDYGLVSREKDVNGHSFNWLVTELRELGLIGKGSHTKFIPKRYLYSTEENRKEILSGLIDTDGSVSKNNRGAIEYSTCSLQLVKDVQFILQTLGIRAKIHQRITKCQTGASCLSYRITWTDKNSVNLRIKRKRDLLGKRKLHRSYRVYIKEFYDFGIQECIDIEIDYPSHLFLLDNFIATHNTFAACQEALKQSILYPKNVGLIGRKDYADLRDTTMKTFFEVVPENLIKRYNKQEHWLLFKNGSEIFFRELKDPLGLGSLDLGWFYIDEAEEVGEDIFRRLKGRLSNTNSKRQCGWITSNPPNKNHWIYKTFEAGESPDCFTVHSSTYDNKEYLPEGYLKDLEKMPESWRRKYLDGEYGFIADGTPFYSGFRDSLHIKEIKANPYKPLLLGWDYGYRRPVCLISQIDDKGRWCILREIMGENIVIDKFSDIVKQILNTSYPGYPSDSYGDPAGSHASDKSEKTSEQILQSKGFNVRSKQSSYRERKEIIEKLLTTLIEDKPSLIVDSSCKTLIDGFLGGYHYPVMKEGSEFQFVKAEAPFKDGHYEHVVNALEYIAVNVFGGVIRSRPDFKKLPRVAKAEYDILGF